jgi:hypothetical protein
MVAPFAFHGAPRDTPEVRVDSVHQSVGGIGVAPPNLSQHFRDFDSFRRHEWFPVSKRLCAIVSEEFVRNGVSSVSNMAIAT